MDDSIKIFFKNENKGHYSSQYYGSKTCANETGRYLGGTMLPTIANGSESIFIKPGNAVRYFNIRQI